ncbi:EAL domain-containing protein [Lentzea sp. DG1S-22]|uniref:putative bifunctional diguanylate cyclase/phosphodiesterase n=1 Tax=Lentzea sp. DG1S-22 TaxID=3108822 RepID=UPI002E762F9F|nr:EAL domain-containing protein [Lentzea sp. DG1S-22]WVH82547.1 EAL domain-containing protein [Lentzea sp. DG1S-22]
MTSYCRTVLDRAGVGYAVTDARGNLLWCNRALGAVLGVPVEQAYGRSLPALLPGVPEVPAPVREVLAPGPKWLEVRCSRLGDDLMYEVVDVSAWRDRELTVTQEADALRRAQALGRMGTWEWSIREDRVTWSDTLLEMFGFEPGTAFDFGLYSQLVHPEDLPMIEETLDSALKTGSVFTYTHRMLRPDGKERVFECFGEVVLGDDGSPLRALGTAHDVTQSSRVHDELVRMAEQDPLTGLPNRRALTRALERELANNGSGALLVLDLDNFKDVNDLRGHAVGDRVMRMLASALQSRLGDRLIARLGGDEFAVVLPGASPKDASEVADGLRDAVAGFPLAGTGTPARITVSTGLAEFGPGDSWELVLANADLALYASKAAGRDRVTVYEPNHYADTVKRVSVLDRLRAALAGGGLALYGMPMVELSSGVTLGHELLLRLEDGQEPYLGPADFLPVAERSNLILDVDRWVLSTAIDALVAQPDSRLRFNVNVSGRTLEDPEFGDFVLDRLGSAGVAPGRLGLEITETAAVTNLDAAVALATQLRGFGCRITLDDFGSGFGSFVHLKHLPITGIKIDGEFVKGIETSDADAVLVSGIVRIADGLGLSAVAEWVERPSQVEALRALGVRVGQGFHLGRPVPLRDVVDAERVRPNGALSSRVVGAEDGARS